MNPLRDLVSIVSASDPWLAFAIEGILRATLALAVALLVGTALRRPSASVRHLVWVSALAGALLIPVLMLALPSWRVPVLPLARAQAEPAAFDAGPASLPGHSDQHMYTRNAVAGTATTERMLEPGRPEIEPTARPISPGAAFTGNWTFWLAAVWCVGVTGVLAPVLTGLLSLRRIGQRSPRFNDGPIVELADRLGGSRGVALLRGDDTISPMTWGVFRPVILLPAEAETWPGERLRAVLLHELAHVQRWDCLTQLLARLTCAIYWFHPLVWLTARQLRIDSERACDDLVLQSGARATEYATHLLDVARAFRSTRGLAAAAVPMARPFQLERRLRAILDASRSHRVVTRRGACIFFAMAAVLLLPLSVARLAARDQEGALAAKKGEPPARSGRMTVAGRVLDPDGRPVPGAKVAIVGWRKLATLQVRSGDQHVVLGRSEAGADGRFQLDAPRTSSLSFYTLHAVAFRAGFGLGWVELNRDAAAPQADIRLKPEQIIEGRLVDLNGAPAGGVTIRTSGVGIAKNDGSGYDGVSLSKVPLEQINDVWPGPVKSDAQGRFRLAGIGRGEAVGLEIDDLRFARQDLAVQTDFQAGPKRATLALQPALRVSGRVTCADTGLPLAGATVMVGAGPDMFSGGRYEFRTDGDGRYDANPPLGKYVRVTVYPPVGSPYLIFERNFEGANPATRQEIDVKVPRGVLVTGRITERGSNRPLSGASVYYENGQGNVVQGQGTIPGWQSAIPSGPDGRYAIAVAPGKGQLLVYGPTAEFVYEVKGSNEIDDAKPGGKRHYAHAFVPYEVKPGQVPQNFDVELKPGVTIAGRVVGPEGQTVDKAEIITTLSISPLYSGWRGDFTVPVRDGHFELHGVASDHHYRCSFLDVKNGWGTTLDVTATMAADGQITVKLQPFGAAKAQLVDEKGRPASEGVVLLAVVATPGPGSDIADEALTDVERSMLAADEEIYVNVDRKNYGQPSSADREGHLTLPALIPGTTYRIYEYMPGRSGRAYRWRDFTAESGRITDLGDVRVKSERP